MSIDLYALVMSPLLRAFFILLGTTTGVWIRFEKVRGNFFSYKAYLDGVELELPDHISLSIQTCRLEFSILDMALDKLVVSNVTMEGARFEYQHVPGRELVPASLPPFLIKNLNITDGTVIFKDQKGGLPYTFTYHLQDYHCESLPSSSLLFHSLFKAQVKGFMDDAPLVMDYHEEGKKCLSHWLIQGLPMSRITPFVNGKLDLLEKSSLNVVMTTEWLADSDEIYLNLQVLIVDLVHFEWPSRLPMGPQLLADALNALINQQVKEIPIVLQFKLRKDDFVNLRDIDTVRLMTAFAEALFVALAEKSRENYSQFRNLGLLGVATFNDLKKLFDKY